MTTKIVATCFACVDVGYIEIRKGINMKEIDNESLQGWMAVEVLLSLEIFQENYPLCKRCNEDKEWAWGLVDDEEFRSQQPESWLALHGDSLRQLKIKFMQLWGGDVDGGGTGHFVMPGEMEGCGITACTCGCGNRETGPSFFRVVD
jgi:hypothetical protein